MRLAIFLSMPAALVSAFGFGFIFEKTRKFLPVLLVILFALASIAVFMHVRSVGWFVPEPERDAMSWLGANPEAELLANQWDRGHPLVYLSGKPVVMDGYFEFAPDLDKRNSSMKVLAQSSDCNTLKTEWKKWNFSHFFLAKNSIDSDTYKYGLFEADCNFISQVYSSDYARILGFA